MINTTKNKSYVKSYAKYTTLKNNFLWFTLGYTTIMRSK